ncbi:MAG TPA: HepT-like ribonuclease domain-containing protein [Burkholderiales bacterium]
MRRCVSWTIAYEMRNALAHGYFKVDVRIVWKTIQTELLPLKEQIGRLLADTRPGSPASPD